MKISKRPTMLMILDGFGINNFDERKKAKVTDYTLALGAYQYNSYGSWWTRSPGTYYSDDISSVNYNGVVGYHGGVKASFGVRPIISLKVD